MNRIVCVTGTLCLAGFIAIACGSDDNNKGNGGGGGADGGGTGGTGGSTSGGTTSGGSSGTGGTNSGGTTTGGTNSGGTNTGGGTTTGGTGGNPTPEGGMPEGGGGTPEAGTPEGGTPSAAFGMCASDADCQAGLFCHRSGNDNPSATLPGYCTVEGCQGNDGATCAQPTSGDVQSTCSPYADWCTLDCSAAGATCPDGMDCQMVTGGQRCVYPQVLAGVYQQCAMDSDCENGLTCHPTLGYCAETCTGDAGACTAPTSGAATVSCSMVTNLCLLNCSLEGGVACPSGMTCSVQQPSGSQLCHY